MALRRWEPFKNIERMFEEDFLPLTMSKLGWDLAVDVYEEGNNVIAEMNLPGINPDNINIVVEDEGRLRISGTREEKTEEKGKSFFSQEIRRGSFDRAVVLPCAVTSKAATAEYENGVLKVAVPKKPEARTDKIKIKVKK